MIKNCKTCALGQIKECPIMAERPKLYCFAWVSDYEEWLKRLESCRRYQRSHEGKDVE